MKAAKNTQATKSRDIKLYVDGPLWAAFRELARVNRRMGSPSQEVQKFMLNQVKTKGGKFGLKAPAHLTNPLS